MAQADNVWSYSFPAAGDLSANQFFPVALDANGRVAIATAAGQRVIGVLQNTPNAIDRAATVMLTGVSKVKAGGVVTRGGPVAALANGKIKDASSLVAATGAASWAFGTALEASAADLTIVSVVLQPMGVIPTSFA